MRKPIKYFCCLRLLETFGLFGLSSSCEDGAAKDVEDGIMDPLERQEVLASLGFRCLLTSTKSALISTLLALLRNSWFLVATKRCQSKFLPAANRFCRLDRSTFKTTCSLVMHFQTGEIPAVPTDICLDMPSASDTSHVSWIWGLDFDYVQPPLRRSTSGCEASLDVWLFVLSKWKSLYICDHLCTSDIVRQRISISRTARQLKFG